MLWSTGGAYRSCLAALTDEQRKKFLPLCLDFVVELSSPSDSPRVLQDKMRKYIENESRFGWLIDPVSSRVYVHHPDRPIRELEAPETVPGDPVLSGFVLYLREIW